MRISLLFEQSGTFKHILNARGHNAEDIDIDNMFDETDLQIDLFKALERYDVDFVYNKIYRADLVIAFFPCTWFSAQNDLLINGTSFSMKTWSEEQKEEYREKRLQERERAVYVLEKLIEYCNCYNIPLIIENPAGSFIKSVLGTPAVAHKRSIYGDWYNKNTYWYTYNCIIHSDKMAQLKNPEKRNIVKEFHHSNKQRKINRSLISPIYAENLINNIELRSDKNYGKTL